MPHLRIRAVDLEHVRALSETLAPELATAMNTEIDNFTFEAIPTEFFFNGHAANGYPFVEVLWFARPQAVQDYSARIITQQIKQLTQAPDVVVVFVALSRESYYENGEHF